MMQLGPSSSLLVLKAIMLLLSALKTSHASCLTYALDLGGFQAAILLCICRTEEQPLAAGGDALVIVEGNFRISGTSQVESIADNKGDNLSIDDRVEDKDVVDAEHVLVGDDTCKEKTDGGEVGVWSNFNLANPILKPRLSKSEPKSQTICNTNEDKDVHDLSWLRKKGLKHKMSERERGEQRRRRNRSGSRRFIESIRRAFEGQKIQGSQNIVAKLISLPFQQCKHSITTVDYQSGNDIRVTRFIDPNSQLWIMIEIVRNWMPSDKGAMF
ncbi:hypothetical protein L2E82_25943 [Cichorium intybus]|uniref:Uncharacterized protein n=1 Tax=Cichorium intybus TaxID=13427 RepID=A0ACB9E4G5_CICIN|nr:hypothetical protein L2E82_25943 [Cichorium intybus]